MLARGPISLSMMYVIPAIVTAGALALAVYTQVAPIMAAVVAIG